MVPKSLLYRLFDQCFPESCAACNRAHRRYLFLCEACALDLPEQPVGRYVGDPPVLALAPYSYQPPVRSAVLRFKHHARPQLARQFAAALAPLACHLSWKPPCFVPVPLHPLRLVERGFNQSALLARALATHTRGMAQPRLLRRVRAVPTQSRLNRQQRQRNVGDAFAVMQRPIARRVLLVDDVVTTGATANSCIEALRSAGIAVGGVLSIAQTPPPDGV